MGWKRRVGAVQAHVTAAAAYPADDDIPDPPHDPDAAPTVTGGSQQPARPWTSGLRHSSQPPAAVRPSHAGGRGCCILL